MKGADKADKSERRRHGAHGQPSAQGRGTTFHGQVRRISLDDREVAILRVPEADRGAASGWSLVAMRNAHWYTVEYVGTLDQAENLARDRAAPNIASHEIRTAFELRRVNLTADLTLATGQAFLDLPLLTVLVVPDECAFRVGNSHRLSLNAGIVVLSDAAERRRNEARGRDSAHYAAIIEERDLSMRDACRDDSALPTRRY